MNRLYLVSMMSPDGDSVDLEAVQIVMNQAHSWFRYSDNSWILCSQQNATTWTKQLSSFLRPGGTIFISRLDKSDHQGRMTKEFWNWFNKHGAHENK